MQPSGRGSSLQRALLLVLQRGVAIHVHGATRDSLLETATMADHVAKVEPHGTYGERHHGGVDVLPTFKVRPPQPSCQACVPRTSLIAQPTLAIGNTLPIVASRLP